MKRQVKPPTPHPSGATPPPVPRDLVPEHVAIIMDGNGRWAKERGLPRTKGHEQGEHTLFDVVEGGDRDRREGDLGLRVLHRELVALARRGALPDGLQPRRDPPPPRRDARARRARALGRPRSAAVEVGDQGAPGRRGDDEGQRRPHPHDVRQLRRPRRARRRRPRRSAARSPPAGSTPTRSTRRPSPATSTSPSCPTPTWSGARRGSSGCPTSCCGRRPTARWSSPTCSGPTSTGGTSGRRSRRTPAATAATAARSPTRPPTRRPSQP